LAAIPGLSRKCQAPKAIATTATTASIDVVLLKN
jgi:hypothetical protein